MISIKRMKELRDDIERDNIVKYKDDFLTTIEVTNKGSDEKVKLFNDSMRIITPMLINKETYCDLEESDFKVYKEKDKPEKLLDTDVKWIVNNLGELGVYINRQCFFCYKGSSIDYTKYHEADEPLMKCRPVGKREFGETVWSVGIENSNDFDINKYPGVFNIGEECPDIIHPADLMVDTDTGTVIKRY